MGSSASMVSLPDEIDLNTCRSILQDRFSQEIFDTYKLKNGNFPKKKLLELSQCTDVFLTHDWFIY